MAPAHAVLGGSPSSGASSAASAGSSAACSRAAADELHRNALIHDGQVKTPVHPLLAAVRELERRDAELATQIEEQTQLEAEIAELRAEAERVSRVRAELPARRERAAQELREAQLDVGRRHTSLCTAEAQVRNATDTVAAERAAATAQTALEDAKARAARVRAEKERVEQDAADAETRAARVAERARAIAERTGGEVGDDVEHWAARARAAVFAERTHAEGERQRVQTEASELAASVTGEALVGDVPRARSAVEAGLQE